MVVLHVKKNDRSLFLFQTNLEASVDDHLFLELVIENKGELFIPSTNISLFINDTNRNPVSIMSLKNIEKGHEYNITLSYKPTWKGKYNFIILVDPDNAISEMDEVNNLVNFTYNAQEQKIVEEKDESLITLFGREWRMGEFLLLLLAIIAFFVLVGVIFIRVNEFRSSKKPIYTGLVEGKEYKFSERSKETDFDGMELDDYDEGDSSFLEEKERKPEADDSEVEGTGYYIVKDQGSKAEEPVSSGFTVGGVAYGGQNFLKEQEPQGYFIAPAVTTASEMDQYYEEEYYTSHEGAYHDDELSEEYPETDEQYRNEEYDEITLDLGTADDSYDYASEQEASMEEVETWGLPATEESQEPEEKIELHGAMEPDQQDKEEDKSFDLNELFKQDIRKKSTKPNISMKPITKTRASAKSSGERNVVITTKPRKKDGDGLKENESHRKEKSKKAGTMKPVFRPVTKPVTKNKGSFKPVMKPVDKF